MTPRFQQGPPRPQLPLPAVPFQEQFSPSGALWAQFFRHGAGYLLRFPGQADFEVSHDGAEVLCLPAEASSGDSIEHLFLNQVVPLALSRSGKLMLHASAVALGARCVAFMGPSGKGKSTLAASFATAGFPFLTDDSLCLLAGKARTLALPSHPSIRMWRDSQTAVVHAGVPCAPPVRYTPKARLLAGQALPFCTEPRELAHVYVLGDDETRDVKIERMTERAALLALVRNSFMLDVDRQESLASQFDKLAEFVSRIEFWHLDYPRRFERLARVRKAIVDHIEVQGGALALTPIAESC